MEDRSALITVNTEIKEEILEDQSTETDRFGVNEEHNYNKSKSGDHYYYSPLHYSINIKEESDCHIETENSYSNEIANETVSDVQTQENILTATNYCDSRQQIKSEKSADKTMQTENYGCSATLLPEQNQFVNIIKKEVPTKSSRKQQIIKTEDVDYELAELHHSINIKEEVEFMETENAVHEDDYNSDTVKPFSDSQYYSIINKKQSRNNNQESADDDPAAPAPGLTRKDIFTLMKNNLNRGAASAYLEIEKFMSEKLQRPFTLSDDAKRKVRVLLSQFNKRWKLASRHENRFFNKFSTWLSVFVLLEKIQEASTPFSSMGRPSLGFAEASVSTKRRKTEDFRTTISTEELSYGAQMSLRAAGRLDVTLESPSRPKKCRESLESISEIPYTPDKALSLVVELNLSKSDYQKLRNSAREQCSKLFPSYNIIHRAKLQCYPSKSDITVTECSAEVKLQSLLNHTIQRILLLQDEVIKNLSKESVRNLNLICKWGCDGTSGQNAYKERFADDDESKSDANIFFTSLVPLQLISVDQETKNTLVVWENPRPSSTRFCRPIRMQFLRESTKATVSEMEFIKQQENNLVPYETVIDGKDITVSFKLAFTIIDGEVCNAITSNASAQRCYLCQATANEFNNIDAMLKRTINEDCVQFGLSTLHAWIRFFECCLHVGYKLEIEKWQARTANDKEIVENRKANIQKGFRIRSGLIVDQPKPGLGSFNDGNTAQRFFEDSTTSASITGVNEDLIKRFHVILQTLSSGHQIDIIRFQDYAVQTARDYVKLYPWFYMPTLMHKILIHGAAIIKSAILPIGQMSEDAQESTNKYIKMNEANFSPKFSKTKTMEDVFSRLLLTSDPYISSLCKLPSKKMKFLLPEAIQLLTAPSVSSNAESSDNASSVESTDCESDCYD